MRQKIKQDRIDAEQQIISPSNRAFQRMTKLIKEG